MAVFTGQVIANPGNFGHKLYLNEIMASNATTVFDEDGDAEDWIEIYYDGDEPLSLESFGLTDDPGERFQWMFPDTTIQPGEFMLIWASGKDRSTPGRPLHTNFRISMDGEDIMLSHPLDGLIDHFEARRIPTDISAGRIPDGTGDWYFFEQPTPGKTNTSEGYKGILEKPVFSYEPGFYTSELELRLEHPDDGVTIHYTLDGSEPDTDSGIWSGENPIVIQDRSEEPNVLSEIPTTSSTNLWLPPQEPVKKAVVVRTKAVKPGYISSRTATGTFVIDDSGANRYTLPVVSLSFGREYFFSDEKGIYVDGGNIPPNYLQRGVEWERPVHIELFDERGTLRISQDAGVRIHGGSTRMFGQKSLRLYARNKYGDNRFYYQIFPDQPYNEYNRFILRNSGDDWQRTMFRDAMAQRLIRHFDVDTQAYRPAIVFLNGEYWGIHNFRERYDRHYLARVYKVDPDNVDLLTHGVLRDVVVKEGDEEHYNRMLEFLDQNDLSDDSLFNQVNEWIDPDHFLDYYSAQIYFGNYDWPHNNVDFWRLRTPYNASAPTGHDGRWRWLLFDVDFAFALHNSDHDMIHWVTRDHWSTVIIRNLLDNDAFKHRFINRIADYLNTAFVPERVLNVIDHMAETIEPEMEEHIKRWQFPGSVSEWEHQIRIMKNFAGYRPESVRNHLMSHFNIEKEIQLTVDVSDSLSGRVYVNNIKIDTATPGIDSDYRPGYRPWSGSYFQHIPVTIRAVPHQGYLFSHWKGIEELSPETDIHASEISLPMDEAVRVIAVFKKEAQASEDSPALPPGDVELYQNYPNPFNHSTVISYHLPVDCKVKIQVFDTIGRRVAVLEDGQVSAGRHEVVFDASGLSSGMYFYRLEAEGNIMTRRMTLIK